MSDKRPGLAAAYGAPPERSRRQQRRAAAFTRDARLERLASLKRSDRAAFDRLSAADKMALAFYETTKLAYIEGQGHDDGSDA